MSQQTEKPLITLVAAAAIGAYIRVKLNGSGQAAIAGLNEPAIGITQRSVASGEQVSVRLLSDSGTFKMTAGAAVAQYALVFGIANGKVDDPATGDIGGALGIALEAATADGDVIEVLPIPSGSGLRLQMGQHTTVAASDTIVTGLSQVYGVVASLNDDPVAGCQFATATIGDQAGTPAAGSILLKTWKATATADTAQIAATTFSKKVNYVAWGK